MVLIARFHVVAYTCYPPKKEADRSDFPSTL